MFYKANVQKTEITTVFYLILKIFQRKLFFNLIFSTTYTDDLYICQGKLEGIIKQHTKFRYDQLHSFCTILQSNFKKYIKY